MIEARAGCRQADVEMVGTENAPPIPAGYFHALAVVHAERLRNLAEQLAAALQQAPDDPGAIIDIHGAALDAWCDADSCYGAYRALLECKGQA